MNLFVNIKMGFYCEYGFPKYFYTKLFWRIVSIIFNKGMKLKYFIYFSYIDKIQKLYCRDGEV